MQDFSNRFAQFRERFGPKQKDLLEKLKAFGISQANLTHWENGKGRPNNDKILAIRKAYPELNVDWLLDGIGEMIIKNTEEKASSIISKLERRNLELEIEVKILKELLEKRK